VDISELKRIQEQLREYADIDKLTGLLNRRSGDLVLDQVIRDSAVNQTHFSVIMGDIDLFKRVNDTYGHL
jgi:diguanylate cyclase (GGDEF)-like protein